MQKKEILTRINELLEEVSQTQKRLKGAVEADLELGVLEQQVITLYRLLKSYSVGETNVSRPAFSAYTEPKVSAKAEEKPQPTTTPAPVVEPQKQERQAPQPIIERTPETVKPQQTESEKPKEKLSDLYAKARETSYTEKPRSGTSINEKLQSKQSSLNEKLGTGQVKKNLAEKLKLSPISDLKSAININQRISFIRELFKGDEKAYKNTLGFISNSKNFSEAKYYIQSEPAKEYGWEDNSALVQEFMELVYRKYL